MLLQVVLAATLCVRQEALPTCSCLCATPLQALRASQSVFVGTVLAVHVGPDTLRGRLGRDSATAIVPFATARLAVESGFKGPRTGVVEVTAFGGADDGDVCGLRFEVGEVYLIYAGPLPWGRVGRLYASACGVCGSGPLARRAEAAQQLRTASATGDTVTSGRSGGRAPAG